MNLREQAQEHYREALELQATDADAAVDRLRQAVFLDPALADAHFALGHLLIGRDDQEGGVRHLRIAVQHQPENPAFSQRLAAMVRHDEAEAIPTESAGVRFDLVIREGQELSERQWLDQATVGNWIDLEATQELLLDRVDRRVNASLLVLAAMAHLVAARRRLRFALPVLPVGPARAAAVELIPTCTELFADLLRLEGPGVVDPTTEANRLSRLGDSLHDAPDHAIAHYQAALRLTPDHAPAHFGLFVVHRSIGDVGGAAEHLLRSLELSPGNGVYRYYYNAWRAADPGAAAILPLMEDAAGPARPATATRRLGPTFRGRRVLGNPARVPMDLEVLDLGQPGQIRQRLDDLLDTGEVDQVLAYAFRLLGRIDARRETMSYNPIERASVQVVSHVAARAHLGLALGYLMQAQNVCADFGVEARTRMTIIELAIARLSGVV